ncbi:enoyl-CoA hydratase/isomerase [Azospirillum argentinense]|uniref:enoyl-CoA hydratase/isomerase n=1 Tax=Azospirillum argentinense TaxID=2970906 RepID=UPI0032DFD2E4
MSHRTIRVRQEPPVCFLTLDRPDAGNAINRTMVEELRDALRGLDRSVHVVVLEGSEAVFCVGADFQDFADDAAPAGVDPGDLYDLWLDLATGPFVSVAHVRGKVNAGGVGFVAACDIALADASAEFSLSELLFGLFPSCVQPFLARRTGFQRAHYLTLTTRPVPAAQALSWGLVDAVEADSALLLRRHLQRLRRLSKDGVRRYKDHVAMVNPALTDARSAAVAANRAMFSDPATREGLARYTRTGLFPWEE